MKGTDLFKKTIQDYLDNKEKTDVLFAERRKAIGRSIDDIVTYILNEVKKSGCNGFADDEIFGMAVHAAEEKDLTVGSPIQTGDIRVNHVEEAKLTDEEITAAKLAAAKRLEDETYQKLKERKAAKKQPSLADALQPSLF